MANRDKDGEHELLLLEILDMSHWTSILNVATLKKDDGLAWLKQAHVVLGAFLKQDKLKLAEAECNTTNVKRALTAPNSHEKKKEDSVEGQAPRFDDTKPSITLHLLLGRLNFFVVILIVSSVMVVVHFFFFIINLESCPICQ